MTPEITAADREAQEARIARAITRARSMLADAWRRQGRDALANSIEAGQETEWIEAGPAVEAIAAALIVNAELVEALRKIGASAPNHCVCCTHMGHSARTALAEIGGR